MGDDLADLQAAAMLLKLKTETLAGQIEGLTFDSRASLRRYKRARRTARKLMNAARGRQAAALARARQMASLRIDLAELQWCVEALEWQAPPHEAEQLQQIKSDLRAIGEQIEGYASDSENDGEGP